VNNYFSALRDNVIRCRR